MRRAGALAVVGFVVTGGVLGFVALESDVSRAYTLRAPILIDGNGAFTPANGVTGGSGTSADPYVIEGWEINATFANGIQILNTDAPFVVRDSYVRGGGVAGYVGVYLDGVANGRVENLTSASFGLGIFLVSSTNVSVTGNNASNSGNGIALSTSYNVSVAANSVSGNFYGIAISTSNDVSVSANVVVANDGEGIYVGDSTNVSITANHVSSNGYGIALSTSAEAHVTANDISDNLYGVSLYSTTNTSIVANEVSNNGMGIYIGESTNILATANNLTDDGIYLDGIALVHYNSHTIPQDNLVDGLPVLYRKDCTGLVVDGEVLGQLLVANCTAVRAANLALTRTEVGIEFAYVEGATIAANGVSNSVYGIDVKYSTDVSVVANRIWDNSYGISLTNTADFSVAANNVSGNTYGILLNIPTNGSVVANIVAANDVRGIWLAVATNVSITANNVSQGGDGIVQEYSATAISITANNVSNNENGIRLYSLTNVSVVANEVSNNGNGIRLIYATNALIHHNRFINNGNQAYTTGTGQWDDGYPSGGNYWSDYGGVDDCSGPLQDVCPDPDGVGDTPHTIETDSADRYPLMSRCGAPPGCLPAAPRMRAARLVGVSLASVFIEWTPSADDGAGERDVAGYEVWHGGAFDASGASYTLLASLPNYTSSFVHVGAGLGDPAPHYYEVRAREAGSGRTAAASDQAGKQASPLGAGWNLVSVPFLQVDWSVASVLQTLSYDLVRVYRPQDPADPWKASRPSRPGDLGALAWGEGIWVKVTVGGDFVTAGLVVPAPAISLAPGWNLVAYASPVPQSLNESLAGVGVLRVEAFDAGAVPYHLRLADPGETLLPGHAYWVLLSAGATWRQG